MTSSCAGAGSCMALIDYELEMASVSDVRCPKCSKLIGGMGKGSSTARFHCRRCRHEVFARSPRGRIIILGMRKKPKEADKSSPKKQAGLTGKENRTIMVTTTDIIL